MNLKEIINQLSKDSKKTPIRGLSAIAEAENYLQQAYEGRYFFELIQNVRDANKEKGEEGEIIIELSQDLLSIANTGAEFSPKGIESITTIGHGTKESQDYIGFKGIGFKSIQEVTESPKIITQYGSAFFNRNLTLKKYNDPHLTIKQVPLFYFPHFIDTKLSDEDVKKGIVTKIELPLKRNITQEKIVDDFLEIQSKQLVLLGNIKNLNFKSDSTVVNYSINKNPQKCFIEVKRNDDQTTKYKYFTPGHKVSIPKEVVALLDGKEKDIFNKSSYVDISIVLELSDNGQFNSIEDAKLYLFYPLLISSGFRFIIHSYFIVNPERTALRDSPLNIFLLSSIGEFIGKEMLNSLKKSKVDTTKILCFHRNNDAKLNALYNSLIIELKSQKFIYEKHTKKYYHHSEIIVTDGFDKGLFPNGRLGEKQLFYTDDREIITWLREEFSIPYLTYQDIANEIEFECKLQLKLKKVKIFQNLYNYVSHHEQLNLTGKKVLLTDNWKLVSSDEDVFYGGSKKNPINLSSSIKKQIHFIHRDIKITDFRDGKSRTGITEFNTFELVRRLLKLFEKNSVPNLDLLNALYNLQPLDSKPASEVKEKILLPCKGSNKWLSPLYNPIYFESISLKELYPNGNFIDESILVWEGEKTEVPSKKEFLAMVGVWEIPAVYISEKPTIVNERENRDKLIGSASGLVSRPYSVRYDRILDKPKEYNYWFTNSIINNWVTYESFIISELLPKMQYSSQHSIYYRDVDNKFTVRFSDFVETLSTQKWIVFSGEEESFSVNEITGIKLLDFKQSHNQVIKKYLKLLPINYDQKKNFIESLGMLHLDGDSITNFIKLFNYVYNKYQVEIPTNKDFIDFYNRLLSKLFDFFYINDQPDSIKQLSGEHFLCINDITKNLTWDFAKQIYYIDDKPNYDLLPLSIKEKVQPLFTNRDKNTFGRIAGRIGKRFSNSIEKELIESEVLHTYMLQFFFSLLPECIALLESSLDIVLNEHFEKLKGIHVYVKDKLEVKILFGELEEMIIPVNHFVDTETGFDIHLSHANISNRNKQIAESISEMFTNLLGRDLRKFNSDLLRFLNTIDKKEYLIDYDILEERVNEIRAELNTFDFTSNQKFWQAILVAKKISNHENIFLEKGVDIKKLSTLLEVKSNIIIDTNRRLNFYQTSISSNIVLLIELLDTLSLTLEDLNKNLFPKIDFREFYMKKLTVLKNNFENGFNSILHSYLLTQQSDEQSNYQDYLDKYKRYFELSVPVNTLKMNIEDYFLVAINSKFSFYLFKKNDLSKKHETFNPIKIYSTQLSLLKEKLKSIEYTNENLELFLSGNKRRSLLYFNKGNLLAETFIDWLKQNSDKILPKDEEENIEEFLKDFSNQTDIEIEEVSTTNVEVHESNDESSGTGKGRRFDGGANDKNKKLIGLVAEMVVFEKLKIIYDQVVWISKFAAKVHKTHPGYNPEGQDGLGYDIEYFDSEGNKFFVEVKGKADNYESFDISKNEIDKAHQEKGYYKVYFVTMTMSNSQRRIRDLGNLFIFKEGEDFFANRQFTALFKNFEIKFKEH